jgi:hypothetical protein
MAIPSTSPSIQNEALGRWLFKEQDSTWKPVKKALRELTPTRGLCERMVLLKPGDRLKFEPKNRSLFRNNAAAQEFTRLDLYAWEGNDNRSTGAQCVVLNTTKTSFSQRTSSMIATRLGCNQIPGSMATEDLCGVCGGKNDCVGCDGEPNSDAQTGKRPL